jgi:predicted Fe-Mo cluster-binding NifX family protein
VAEGQAEEEGKKNWRSEEMVKIVFPVSDQRGEQLSDHFGRAPFFAWYVVEGGKVLDKGVAPNDSEHFGGTGLPPDRIAALGAEVVISLGMGMKAIQMFQEKKLAVLEAISPSPIQNIVAYSKGELKELTRGCLQGHQH